MTPLDEMLRLAAEATQGDWRTGCKLSGSTMTVFRTIAHDGCKTTVRIAQCDSVGHYATHKKCEANAEHIAACSPEAIRSLIESHERLREACTASAAVLPGLEVRSWPPGHKMKKDALDPRRDP